MKRICVLLWFALLVLVSANPAFAQPSSHPNWNGHWNAPATESNVQRSNHFRPATDAEGAFVQQTLTPNASPATSQATLPSNSNWPTVPATFNSQIQNVKFESTESATGGSLESTISSTGEALFNFKQSVSAKAKGLLASFSGKEGGAGGVDLKKMISSLALVLGGYFGFVWLMRKISPASNSQIPSEVLQVLGRTSFGPRQNLQLVRMGSKLLLLMNGPEGTHPIGEITDPAEVQHLSKLCNPKQRGQSNSFGMFGKKAFPSIANVGQAAAQAAAQVAVASDPNAQGLASVLRTLENVAKQQQPQQPQQNYQQPTRTGSIFEV